MLQVHELSTSLRTNEWVQQNASAIAAGKAFSGKKWTVSIGEWGTRTFLVLGAENKEEAKSSAMRAAGGAKLRAAVRNVSTYKKYQ
ncbi:MAG: hypothetical protein PHQ85_10465 [Eubacteriales bacterium]|nr:hypothetical protein [Eubacteriales bacterium]